MLYNKWHTQDINDMECRTFRLQLYPLSTGNMLLQPGFKIRRFCSIVFLLLAIGCILSFTLCKQCEFLLKKTLDWGPLPIRISHKEPSVERQEATTKTVPSVKKSSAKSSVNSSVTSSNLSLNQSANYSAPVKTHRIADACIIGARKTGTATIQSFLRLNPFIATKTNETWFFDSDYNYERGAEYYAQMLPAAYDNQTVMDVTPRYFIIENVPRRIKDVNPKMTLVLSVRDPVTRLISEYTHNRNYGDETRPEVTHSFDQMVFTSNGTINTTYIPLDSSIYIKHLKRWTEHLLLSQFCIVDGEKFIKDPGDVLQQLENCLNIPPLIKKVDFVFNERKGFFCIKRNRKMHCMSGSKGRKHPDVSRETLRQLYEFYEPYNAEFMEYTGLNFSWHMKSS